MALPVQITFHGLPASPSLADYVLKKAEKLGRLHARITHFRVAIEAPHKHQRAGSAFRVRIDLGVPRDELVVSRHHDGSPNDAYAAVDLAFDDAQRTLRDHAAVARGDVKPHAHRKHGKISKLFSYEGYGFVRDELDDEFYFHRNSVENGGFGRMRVGSRVSFAQSETDDGGHASHVVLLRGHQRN